MLFEGFEVPRPRLVINLLMSMECSKLHIAFSGTKDNPYLPNARRSVDAMAQVRECGPVYNSRIDR